MRKRTKLLGAVAYLGAGQAYVMWRSKVSGKPISFGGFKDHVAEHAEHAEHAAIAENPVVAKVVFGGMYGFAVVTWPGLAVRRGYLTLKGKPEKADTDRS